MTLGELMAALGVKSSPLDMVPAEPGVRTTPEGGLNLGQIMQGAGIDHQRSQYEKTLRPGEARSAEDLQAMLGEVILAAGVEQLPGLAPHKIDMRAPGRVRPGHEKQFNEWFRDSKAVDAEGKPLTVYHGSPEPGFNEFKHAKRGSNTGVPDSRFGFHFSSDPRYANEFTYKSGDMVGAVKPAHISVKNPLEYDMAGTPYSPSRQLAVMKQAEAAGHDGVVFRNKLGLRNELFDEWVPFHPSQIKSATGNRGTYRRDSADIRE
jgi:hypothetical protein